MLLFGPRRLPELAKSLGKGLRDFKKAVSGEFDEKEVVETPKRETSFAMAPPRQIATASRARKKTAARPLAKATAKKARRKKSA